MEKFKDLVITDLENLVEELLEKTRTDMGVSVKDFQELLKKNNEIFDIVDSTLSEFIISLQNTDYIDDWRTKSNINQGVIMNEHKAMFLYYFMFVNAAFVVFNRIKDALNKTTIDISDLIPICILGTLARMSDEIGTLLSVGATKAALSTWRSFYDHAVIGMFLMTKDSPDLYKKFADYSHRDVKRKKDFFDKHREELKFPVMEEERSAAISERTEALKEQYGADFFKDYNWAKDYLSVRPTFLAIEEEAGMSRYRSFYIWASDYMHPNFNAMANFNEDEKVILDKIIEPVLEKESFIDPMQLTLGIFTGFLNLFLHKYSLDHQYATNMKLFNQLYKKMSAEFSAG